MISKVMNFSQACPENFQLHGSLRANNVGPVGAEKLANALKENTRECLRRWKQANGVHPKRMIWIRDGVANFVTGRAKAHASTSRSTSSRLR